MTLGQIQDLEGAQTIAVSYKTTTGGATPISRQLFNIVYSAYTKTGRLTMDKDAAMGGKQIPRDQRRWIILVYKTYMHSESQLNSTLCGAKADPRTRHTWLIGTLRQLD